MRHHAVGADNRTVADAHAGQNRSTNANPYLVLDDNGTTVCRAAVIGIRVVVDGDKVHLRSNEHTVTDGDAATVEESATLLYPASLADADVLAVIHIERGQQCRTLINLPACNAVQIFMHFFRREPAFCIHFRSCRHRVEDGADQFVIARLVG